MLLRWDKWLFFGHSPAVLLHDLLGQDLAARLLTDLYESFSTAGHDRAGRRARLHADGAVRPTSSWSPRCGPGSSASAPTT